MSLWLILVLVGAGTFVLVGVSAGVWVGARLHAAVSADMRLTGDDPKQLEPAVLAEFGGLKLLKCRKLQDRYVMTVQDGRKVREYLGHATFWRDTRTLEYTYGALDTQLQALLQTYLAAQSRRVGTA